MSVSIGSGFIPEILIQHDGLGLRNQKPRHLSARSLTRVGDEHRKPVPLDGDLRTGGEDESRRHGKQCRERQEQSRSLRICVSPFAYTVLYI